MSGLGVSVTTSGDCFETTSLCKASAGTSVNPFEFRDECEAIPRPSAAPTVGHALQEVDAHAGVAFAVNWAEDFLLAASASELDAIELQNIPEVHLLHHSSQSNSGSQGRPAQWLQ